MLCATASDNEDGMKGGNDDLEAAADKMAWACMEDNTSEYRFNGLSMKSGSGANEGLMNE
jgi:hypothetical protein